MLLLISVYIADLVFGDPEQFPHPVRLIGKFIKLLEAALRTKRSNRFIERIKGVILGLLVIGVTFATGYLFITTLKRINPFLGNLAWVYLGYTVLSLKDLRVKAKNVYRALKKGPIFGAQRELSKIVGRDTQNLSEDRIIVATIESIAENTNDGIVAPLFYLILGGPVLAIGYKAINTLDSMVGYRNEKYLDFGWFSARLDDAANFIPARISGFLISISSLISGKGFKDSFKTMLRDGKKHSSPNSGISEAAMAGALGIRLGGVWSYQGKPSVKPYLGEGENFLQPSFINSALTISLIASVLMVSIGVILKWLI
jgi:adenosylcobinamide-phosphate synthase